MDGSAKPAEPASPDGPSFTGTRPRFPWLAAAFCAVALGVAVWAWMGYSHTWDVTPARLHQDAPLLGLGTWGGMHVCIRGRVIGHGGSSGPGWISVLMQGPRNEGPPVKVLLPEGSSVRWHANADFSGRVVLEEVLGHTEWVVDTTASRLHPASISGLAVGAMGLVVFGVYVRSWLRERKAAA